MSLSTVTYRTDELRNLTRTLWKLVSVSESSVMPRLQRSDLSVKNMKSQLYFRGLFSKTPYDGFLLEKNAKILVLILKSNYKRTGDPLFW